MVFYSVWGLNDEEGLAGMLAKMRHWYIIRAAVQTVAATSPKGKASHTPSSCMVRGSKSISGMRNMTWRASERNMLLPALPMLWKKWWR